MKIGVIALGGVLAFCGTLAHAQGSAGGGGGGGSSAGGSGVGGNASGGAVSSVGPASSAAGGSATTFLPGTHDGSTVSNTLQNAPGTPRTQPNTYDALSQGTSANQMGTIGGSNSNGPGSAAPGSSTSNLSSTTNTGVMAPSSNTSVQPSGR